MLTRGANHLSEHVNMKDSAQPLECFLHGPGFDAHLNVVLPSRKHQVTGFEFLDRPQTLRSHQFGAGSET